LKGTILLQGSIVRGKSHSANRLLPLVPSRFSPIAPNPANSHFTPKLLGGVARGLIQNDQTLRTNVGLRTLRNKDSGVTSCLSREKWATDLHGQTGPADDGNRPSADHTQASTRELSSRSPRSFKLHHTYLLESRACLKNTFQLWPVNAVGGLPIRGTTTVSSIRTQGGMTEHAPHTGPLGH